MKNIFLSLVLMLLFISCDEDIAAPEYPSTNKSQITTQDLNDIWGFSDNNIYAVGANGTILYYNGSEWQPITSDITEDILSIWGTDPGNIYFKTESEKIYHYSGSLWTEVLDADQTDYNFKGTWELKDKINPAIDEKLDINYHIDYWHLHITNQSGKIDTISFILNAILYDLIGFGLDDIFMSCTGGTIRHFNGKTWTDNLDNKLSHNALYAIHGYDRFSLYAVGFGGTILYYDYLADLWIMVDKVTTEALNGVWVSDSKTGYIVGNHGTLIVMKR